MRATGRFGDSDTEYEYVAFVTWSKLDNEFIINNIKRQKKSLLDIELYYNCEITDEWIEIEQHHNIFFDRDLENKLNVVINEQWDEINYIIDRSEQ